MKFTQAGLAVIKDGEGCRLTAYQDSVHVWTIGYGHTGPEVVEDLTWTQQEAEDTLVRQLEAFISVTQHVVTNTKISDNQFSALVSLHYNIGIRNFTRSSVLRYTNSNNLTRVADAFMLYNKGHDRDTNQIVIIQGLKNRRESEIKLWNTPDTTPFSGSMPGTPPTPITALPAELRLDDSGVNVRLLQHLLINKGHFMDGLFGPQTETAVKEFQRSRGLSSDGIVGPATWKALGGLTPELG